MNRTLRITIVFLLVTLGGCKRFPNPFEGEKVLAKAGKETLSLMDLDGVIPVGIAGADSVKWIEDYVDRWVRDNLKLQEAMQLFGDNAADEELVRAYRNTLTTMRLDEYFIRQTAGDSLYVEKDLHDFYDEHKGEFVLDRSIVKGRVVAFPSSLRQKARLKTIFASWALDARDEVSAMAQKNAFTLREVNDWMEYPGFLALLPTRRNASYDDLLSIAGVQEMVDGGTTYWFVISEKRTAGETAPYEMVSEMVRQSVATRRRAEIIKACEDSLYKTAMLKNKAVINL